MKEKLYDVEIYMEGPMCLPFLGVTAVEAVDLEQLVGRDADVQMVINNVRNTFQCKNIMAVRVCDFVHPPEPEEVYKPPKEETIAPIEPEPSLVQEEQLGLPLEGDTNEREY